MAANTSSNLQLVDQGVILTFKPYYLKKNSFHKSIASIGNYSDGFEQSKLETIWKGFTILDAIKNICDSWEEIKYQH